MKNTLLVLIALLAVAVAASAQPSLLWEEFYLPAGADNVDLEDVIVTSDGGFFAVGRVSMNDYGQGYLVKTDAEGNVEWDLDVGDGGWGERMHQALETAPGVFYAVGSSYHAGQNTQRGYMVKVENGTLTDSQFYDNVGREALYGMIQDGNGGFWACGSQSDGGGQFNGYLLRIDGNLNQLNRYVYPQAETFQEIKPRGNGFVCAGWFWDLQDGSEYYAWVGEFDAAGSIQWQETFGIEDEVDGLSAIALSADETKIMCVGSNTTSGAMLLARVDAVAGQLEWMQLWDWTDGEEYGHDIQLAEGPDEEYYVLGQGDYAPTQVVGEYLFRVESDGTIVWQVAHADSDPRHANRFVSTGPDEVVSVGLASSFGPGFMAKFGTPDPWEVYLDPDSPPVIIPAGGGSFEYYGEINNVSADMRVSDIWITITYGPSRVTIPLHEWYDIPFPAGGARQGFLSQGIPAWAPAGTYVMMLSVGDNPAEVEASASFTVTKQGTAADVVEGTFDESRWRQMTSVRLEK